MARAMTTNAIVTAWAPQTTGVSTTVLDRCIEAASVMIERITGQNFVSTTYTALHSGSLARGAIHRNTIWLEDPDTGRATPNVTSVSSLTANGASVTTLITPTALTGSDCAVVKARTGEVQRVSISGGTSYPLYWEDGWGNIRIVYVAGWAQGSIPEDVNQVCCNLSWLLYRQAMRVGVDSMQQGGNSANFRQQLDPGMREILDAWTIVERPRTLFG